VEISKVATLPHWQLGVGRPGKRWSLTWTPRDYIGSRMETSFIVICGCGICQQQQIWEALQRAWNSFNLGVPVVQMKERKAPLPDLCLGPDDYLPPPTCWPLCPVTGSLECL
jgi:hypothetical protein